MNATKMDREQLAHGAPTEKQYLRERVRIIKAERDEARMALEARKALFQAGWTISKHKCGFIIITLPGGKHYCPKCAVDKR